MLTSTYAGVLLALGIFCAVWILRFGPLLGCCDDGIFGEFSRPGNLSATDLGVVCQGGVQPYALELGSLCRAKQLV